MKLFVRSVLVALTFLFVSCGNSAQKTEQSLDGDVYWALGDREQTSWEAETLEYEPLDLGYGNISEKVGSDTQYVWVRIRFKINDNLKNQTLGLLLPYVHFAEKLWLNHCYIGKYGEFGENPYSPMYQAHFYSLPEDLLSQTGENYIYMLVMSYGIGTVSSGIIIDKYEKAAFDANRITYNCSKIYMIFAGILLCAFVSFLIFFFVRRQKYILNFSMICLTTFVFLSYFFAPEMPAYGIEWFNMLWFTKIVLCCFFYFIVYTIVTFILTFIDYVQPKAFIIFKRVVVLITIIITFRAPTYQALMKLCKPMLVTYLLHFIFGMSFVIKALRNPEKKGKAVIALLGFSPMAFALAIDLIIRQLLRNVNYPYFVLFGWEITITYFIVYFSLEYGRVFRQNQRLTDDLRGEVELRTADLTNAKNRLEQEIYKSERDMQMASIVQQKFFPMPTQKFAGWELDITYDPLDQVSGDLYDFYTDDGITMQGFSLFDASGHGVAAALITMLAKNIIYKSFQKAYSNYFPLSYALKEINEEIIEAKGDVENYLTGIFVRFGEMNSQNGSCKIELSSAGHPYPVVYSAESKKCISLKDLENGPHYGAIGMAGIEVAYCDIEFTMQKGDILLCFSDGITETADIKHNEYGRGRLERLVENNSELSSKELKQLIQKDVSSFRGENPRDDDITLIILKKE